MPAEQVRLDLSEGDLQELIGLARSSDKLDLIIEAAGRVGQQIGTSAVAKLISGKVGMSFPDLRRTLAALLNYYHTQTRSKVDAKEIAEAIADNLRRNAESSKCDDDFQLWQRVKEKVVAAIGKLTPDHPLEAAYKAIRVTTSRQYEYVGEEFTPRFVRCSMMPEALSSRLLFRTSCLLTITTVTTIA